MTRKEVGTLKLAAVMAAALMTLSACDLVRTPWDDGPAPEVPEAGPVVPPGAPGPPPPGTPVEDPYNTGNPIPIDPDPDTPEPTDTSGAPDTSPDTPADTTPVSDTDVDPDPVTADPETPIDPPAPVEPVFSYHGPGALLPGSGQGATEQLVHSPDMTFPIAGTPAYLQSQVFTYGGGIGGGDQCDARNYAYPWRDNFCETRSRNRTSPFCPTSKVHQGQDIRVGTPADCSALRAADPANRVLHRVVAAEDGIISHIGSYSVNLRSGPRIYKYMHMNMGALQVEKYGEVKAGDLLGYVSNDFGGTPTTFHLHFEIVQNTASDGWAHVPPYMSLVKAYERREEGPGEEVEANISIASAPVVIPEGFEIIE